MEINSGGNGNKWLQVETLGTAGITTGGRANRDGIGAVVTVEVVSESGETRQMMRPVLGGSSYASQDSLTSHFGLGDSQRGQVDVLWPGGVRNRLYGAREGEQLLFPEIPCSIDGDWPSLGVYADCLKNSLGELQETGVVTRREERRFFWSAVLAYFAEQ